MASYVALIHEDEGTSFGVSFPDVPAAYRLVTQSKRRWKNAAEALAGHLAVMRADGDPIPASRSARAIKADPELADDLAGALVRQVEPNQAVVSGAG